MTTNYGEYIITTDKGLMHPDDVFEWLSERSYWAKGMTRAIFDSSFEHSYCVGAIYDGRQVGYGRLVTDFSVFGYLADVYVAEEHRKQGISMKMMEMLFAPDWVQGLRRIMLATTDAHGLYRQFGFTECKHPEKLMERIKQQ
jgi:GNAT superfamily N-acetyltransferase